MEGLLSDLVGIKIHASKHSSTKFKLIMGKTSPAALDVHHVWIRHNFNMGNMISFVKQHGISLF